MSVSDARPDVTVCVAVYREHPPPNLATLASALHSAFGPYRGELVVALNGIDAEAAGAPAWAEVVDLGVNRGVPVAWNAAARVARGRHLVFANDDLGVGEGAVARLVKALDDRPDAGVVGPVGTDWDLSEGRHRAYLPAGGAPGDLRECDVVSGFFFATPAEVFASVGGFDEAFTPCSWEEVDYCTAVRVRLGRRCYEVVGVEHEHEFGISSASSWRRVRFDGRSERIGSIARRNRRHFLEKWRRDLAEAGLDR